MRVCTAVRLTALPHCFATAVCNQNVLLRDVRVEGDLRYDLPCEFSQGWYHVPLGSCCTVKWNLNVSCPVIGMNHGNGMVHVDGRIGGPRAAAAVVALSWFLVPFFLLPERNFLWEVPSDLFRVQQDLYCAVVVLFTRTEFLV